MARLPRLSLAGYVHHLIQRGLSPVFYTDDDRKAYLAWLSAYAKEYAVAVHAYVLLDQRVHLLVTPQTDRGVPQLMQAISRRYAQYFNQFHNRAGTLWNGRYKSSLIEPKTTLLATMVLFDTQPVAANLAHTPYDYVWSSHRHYSGEQINPMLTPHPIVWELGNTPFAREKVYKELVQHGNSPQANEVLVQTSLKSWVLGSEAFLRELQNKTTRRITKLSTGRPTSKL